MANKITFEERVLAALSHINVVAYFMGIIVPAVIWVTQKDKSAYVRFQALQATVFQLILLLVFMGGIILYILSFIPTLLLSFIAPKSGIFGPTSFILPFIILFSIFLLYPLFIVYGLYAAYSTYRGRDFRYIIIGRRIVEKLGENDGGTKKQAAG